MDLGLPDREKTAFVLIDLQDRLGPVINELDKVIDNANTLNKAAEAMKIPLIVTEQYPTGLGSTIKTVYVPENAHKIEKTEFDCFESDKFVEMINELGIYHLVIYGIESHICVLKTALGALKHGRRVYVVADATSSRSHEDKSLAMDRLRQSGVFVVSSEMVLFQLMEKAGTDEFKKVSRLIR